MHTSCIYLEILSFYLYIQPKIISKCITLMTSKGQRHTIVPTKSDSHVIFCLQLLCI